MGLATPISSIRAKLTLGVVVPLLLILGTFTVFEYARHRATVLANLSLLASHSGQVVENNLRREMLAADPAAVQSLLDVFGESGDFQLVYILDLSGKVIFAPQGEGVGLQLDDRQPDCQPCHRLAAGTRPDSMVVTTAGGQRVLRSMLPIENSPECADCHAADQQLLGLLLTDISLARLEVPLAADLRENLLWWAGTILAVVLIVNLGLRRFVLRPLEQLFVAITGFGEGHLSAPMAEIRSDEFGRIRYAFDAMVQRIEARDRENRSLSETLRRRSAQRGELLNRLITAQEAERKRVARELHDELGRSLGGLALQAEAIDRLIVSNPDRARQQLRETRRLIGETTDRTYDLILALRPSALDDLGLVAALQAHAARVLRGSTIDFEVDANQLTHRLPPEMETALYRIFQEALSNVVRHAHARHVWVKLACHDHVFVGEFADDGCGFDPQAVPANGDSQRGLGLLGMQERVVQCGGQMEIISSQGQGARLRIRIPLSDETRA